jgi:aerotaxis receptor
MSYNNSKEIMLADNAFIVTETDSKGKILFANEEFCQVAEFAREELIGQHHNLVRHPDMPKDAFKDLWETVKVGKVWHGYVKNKTKHGNYYWVHATVYPFVNEHGEQCFLSCRRKPPREKIVEIEKHYQTLSRV